MIKRFAKYLTIACAALLWGCVEEDAFNNSPQGNFDALWSLIDERYCFFSHGREKFGLDWDAVRQKYSEEVKKANNGSELFNICSNMLGELRDGHVNLSSVYGTSYYWDWQLAHPANFSDSLQRNYLGNKFTYTAGIKYTTLPDNIGYAYLGSFEGSLNGDNITMMLINLSATKGLILDIRNNGGGQLTSAEKLASYFVNEKTHCGYIQHKTGKGHDDFSTPEPLYLHPTNAFWGKPVVLLTNRGVYSAANYFTMLLKPLPQVIVLGDTTGGGSGLPLNSTLPNGWTVRFSACPILDTAGQHTEFGIAPHIEKHITSPDWQRGKDTIIESAITLINHYTDKKTVHKIDYSEN